MMKCTALRLPYSRHKLTYENEAVSIAYSYITTNSQTRADKPGILLGPWCRCHQPADGWLQAGDSPFSFLLQLLAQGRAPAVEEARGGCSHLEQLVWKGQAEHWHAGWEGGGTRRTVGGRGYTQARQGCSPRSV